MARIRTIKSEFFRSRSISRCSKPARLTFIGLWCEADDLGNGIADARVLKGVLWPLDDDITPRKIEMHLAELEKTGHIQLYRDHSERYYSVLAWSSHQSPAFRRGEGKYPLPPARTFPHDEECNEMQESALLGTGNREQGTGISIVGSEETDNISEDGEEGVRPEVLELCDVLANHIAGFLGSAAKRPKVTKKWHKDMRLLIDRGPLGRDDPEAFEPQRIRNSMEILFTKMAEPEGRSGFCWAAQVQSPNALRKHWDKISIAWNLKQAAHNEPDYWISPTGDKVYS